MFIIRWGYFIAAPNFILRHSWRRDFLPRVMDSGPGHRPLIGAKTLRHCVAIRKQTWKEQAASVRLAR